jgi:hypothetical protein
MIPKKKHTHTHTKASKHTLNLWYEKYSIPLVYKFRITNLAGKNPLSDGLSRSPIREIWNVLTEQKKKCQNV